jgi:hypothetical protein
MTFDEWIEKEDNKQDWEDMTPTEQMKLAWDAAMEIAQQKQSGECREEDWDE